MTRDFADHSATATASFRLTPRATKAHARPAAVEPGPFEPVLSKSPRNAPGVGAALAASFVVVYPLFASAGIVLAGMLYLGWTGPV